MTGSDRSILIFARDGYHAEQRIAPCRDGFDAEVLPNLNASALQALGLALLDDRHATLMTRTIDMTLWQGIGRTDDRAR